MNRFLLATALVLLACGTVLSTGAFPADGERDELDPDNETGLYLIPADTPNGDRYAEIGDEGKLNVTIDVIAGTRTIIDDVFVVAFGGVEGTNESAELWIEHDSDVLTFRRMDTGQPVESPVNSIELAPNESVMLGLTAETPADESGTIVEQVTYRALVPDRPVGSEPTPTPTPPEPTPTPDDPTPTPDEPTPTPDDPTPTPDEPTPTPDDPTPTPGEPTPTPTPTPGEPAPTPTPTPAGTTPGGPTPTPDPSPALTPAQGENPTVIPGLGALPFAFGTALLPWYVWLLLSGTLMVVVDYLTQTRVRGVVPLLETPRQTKLPRMRYVLLRLGLLWVTVLVVALVATTLLWGVGIQGLVAFLTVLVGSILLGAGLGYFLLPDIEGDYLPVSMRQRQP